MVVAQHFPALQVLIPFFGALISAIVFHQSTAWLIAVIAAVINLGISLYALPLTGDSILYSFGGWAAPVGIEYCLDYLNQPIIIYSNAVLTFLLVFCRQLINKTVTRYIDKKKRHLFYSLLLFAHAGYLGVLATNDLFNMYVFIEISSLATYVLVSNGNNPKAVVGALDYLMLGTIGATLILISIGFFFSVTGSLNISDIANILEKKYVLNAEPAGLKIIITATVFFLTGAILKMAFFPLHFWMIRAYSSSAPIIITYLASISSLLGIYIITRFLHYVIDAELVYIPVAALLRVLAIATLVLCTFLALRARDIKMIIIYSSASQVGYIFLLLSVWPAKSLLFQLLILDSINKVGCFTLLSHIQNKVANLKMDSMKQIQNSIWFKTLAAFIIIYSAGMPLTGMFLVKIKIFELLIRQNLILEFATVIIATALGLLYHLKLAKAIFFAKEKNGMIIVDTNILNLVVIVAVQILTLLYMNEISRLVGYNTELMLG